MPSTDAETVYALALAMLADELTATVRGYDPDLLHEHAAGHVAGLLALASAAGLASAEVRSGGEGVVEVVVRVRPPRS